MLNSFIFQQHKFIAGFESLVNLALSRLEKTTAIRPIINNLSMIKRSQLRSPLIPLGPSQHSIVLRGLRGALNWVPIMPRHGCNSGGNFPIPITC